MNADAMLEALVAGWDESGRVVCRRCRHAREGHVWSSIRLAGVLPADWLAPVVQTCACCFSTVDASSVPSTP